MDLKSTPLLSIAEIITAAGAGCSVCLLILLFVGVLLGGNLEKKLYRYFFALVLLMLTGSMSEFALPLLLRGPDKGGTLSIVVNFLNYAMGSLILAAFILYLYEYLSIRGRFSKKTLIIELCLSLANIPLMAGALLGQLSVMPQERSIALLYSTPWQSLIFPSLTLIIGATVTIRNAKKLRTREWVSLLTYMAIPMLCYGIEFAFKNVWITYLGSSIAVFLVYVNIQVELGRRVKAQELEIAESRVDIMLSQIQPHFVLSLIHI